MAPNSSSIPTAPLPAPGAAGGEPGSRGAFRVLRNNEEIILPSKTRFKLRKGDVIASPFVAAVLGARPIARSSILRDLADGKISRAHLFANYPQAAAAIGHPAAAPGKATA